MIFMAQKDDNVALIQELLMIAIFYVVGEDIVQEGKLLKKNVDVNGYIAVKLNVKYVRKNATFIIVINVVRLLCSSRKGEKYSAKALDTTKARILLVKSYIIVEPLRGSVNMF